MDTFRNGAASVAAAYQEWSYIYVQCTDSICWMLCVHSTTHTEGGRICFWYCRECIFEGSPEEATWSWQAHLLFSRESPSSTFYYLCKIVRCTDTGLKNTGFIIGTIYMRRVRNMFAFNGPHYLLDGTSEQELKCKQPPAAVHSISQFLLHTSYFTAWVKWWWEYPTFCKYKSVHIVYYTMFTLWNKPPLRTLALQPGKCSTA